METVTGLAPIPAKERIAALDVIRGVAVLGILLMNITVFGMPFQATFDPTVYGGADGANLRTWVITEMFFEGTQRGLFTLLFGAGVIVFTERMAISQRPNAADLYFRRNLWLIVFGVLHGFLLLWFGDILFAYGVIALFVYAFRKAAPATLLWFALGGLALNAAWNQLDVYSAVKAHEQWQSAVVVQQAGGALSGEQTAAIEAWEAIVREHKPDSIELQKAVDASRGSYFEQLAFQAPLRSELQAHLVYRSFFDMFSMMLLGMALFRMGLFQSESKSKVYWRMVLIGYVVGLSVNFVEVRYVVEAHFSVLAQLRAKVSYDIGRLAMTAGHVGLLMLLCKSSMLQGLKRRLAAVGQMAFTNYVSHSIICAFVFFGVGLGLFGQLQRYQLYYVVFGIWVFQLLVSPVWLAHYRYGPLEWLWRSLTYGKRQPMRRGAAIGVIAEPLA